MKAPIRSASGPAAVSVTPSASTATQILHVGEHGHVPADAVFGPGLHQGPVAVGNAEVPDRTSANVVHQRVVVSGLNVRSKGAARRHVVLDPERDGTVLGAAEQPGGRQRSVAVDTRGRWDADR